MNITDLSFHDYRKLAKMMHCSMNGGKFYLKNFRGFDLKVDESLEECALRAGTITHLLGLWTSIFDYT